MELLLNRDHSSDVSSPVCRTVVDWLRAGFCLASDRSAICHGSKTVCYEELDRRSNQLANYLIGLGVKPGDRIGLSLDRSVEMVSTLIGILKSGAAYVPLDPGYPEERLRMMKADAGLNLILVHQQFEDPADDCSDRVLVWETAADDIDTASDAAPDVEIAPESLAYIIFTSGSTGRPKGIAMPHRALANLIEWQLTRESFKPGARVLQYSSISFDVSFQEIATTLASGGALHLIPNEDRMDPRRLLDHLEQDRIERLFLPFVALRGLVEAAHVTKVYPTHLQEVITAGEQLKVDDAVRSFFSRLPGTTLDNQYGPSETHVITAQLLNGNPSGWADLPSIGKPVTHNGVFILDKSREPVAAGEEGELYLAGRNLARGYLTREEAGSEAFVSGLQTDPVFPVYYKTGDLGLLREDGCIEFRGRVDHQIKIRGYRVEPGEIDLVLGQFPGIQQSVTHTTQGGESRRLISHYQVRSGCTVDATELRKHARVKLPDYMVPSFLIEVDEFPRTPSGKVNLKALTLPEHDREDEEPCGYESETEEELAGLWRELLGVRQLSPSADFFALGGDSILAVTLFLKIQQRFGVDLPLSTLMQTSTLGELAECILQVDSKGDLPEGLRSLKLIRKGDGSRPPLFLIHGGAGNVLIFRSFAEQLDEGQAVYGFQWSGWDGMAGERTIPEMAEVYKKELLQVCPSGPCRIGGNCIGGFIAVELSRLLVADGYPVEGPLIVWDAPNLWSRFHRDKEPWGDAEAMASFERMKADLTSRAVGTGEKNIHAEPAARTCGLIGMLKRIPGLHPFELWLKALPKVVRIRIELLRHRPVPMDLRPFYCLRCMIKAVKQHRSHSFEGRILYFRSFSVLGRDFSLPGWWNDPFLGFREICTGSFEGHVVGRGHNDVVGLPEVADCVRNAFKQETKK